jgi:hypothetical protein
MDKPLDVEVLLVWGRDWQRHLEAEAAPGRSFHVPTAVLKQYLERANEGLALLKQHEERGRGGRPRGTGMGAKAASLIACVRMTPCAWSPIITKSQSTRCATHCGGTALSQSKNPLSFSRGAKNPLQFFFIHVKNPEGFLSPS